MRENTNSKNTKSTKGTRTKAPKDANLPAMFYYRANIYKDKVCVKYKKDGSYTGISWNEMKDMVEDLSCWFMEQGLKKGDRVAVFSENRWEWWVADMAALAAGGITVPIYASNSPDEAMFILKNSESTFCVVSDSELLGRVLEVKKKLNKLKKIIIFDEPEKTKADVISFAKALKEGRALKEKKPQLAEGRTGIMKPSDIATIIYTSGTTGDPKGVMLTHDNFLSQLRNMFGKTFGHLITTETVFLSFLPLSHALERTAGYYGPIYNGCTVAFAESIKTILENMKEIRPTVLVSVPRIYEKLRAGILAKAADSPLITRSILKMAFATAKKNMPYYCVGKARTGLFALRFNLFNKLVYKKLKEETGMNRLQMAVSGGGPLSISDAEFFIGMDVPIIEGYGLTETSPVTHVSRPGNLKPGTVGHPLPETQVKISDEGEILIKGPQVMAGYYKNAAETKKVMTSNGFFKTGDIGMLDETDRLTITGRMKDIIITAGGKNISPQNIEGSLKTSPFIEHAAVIGDRRKYLSALIVPTFEYLEKWASKNGVVFKDRDELISNQKIIDLFESEILANMKNFARVEQIRSFKLLNAEWSQDGGELTPSQKVKRRVIEEKYADEIESMYPSEAD